MSYPITIRMTRKTVSEFRECELGAYEDAENSPELFDEPPVLEKMAYAILGRHESKIEIFDRDEMQEIWEAVCSGTFSLHHYSSACRVADILMEYQPDRSIWRYPEAG